MRLLFNESVESLRAHPLRTVLTAIGIAVGVASLVTMAMLLNGVAALVVDSVQGLGAGTFYVLPVADGLPGAHHPRFTEDDFRALRDELGDSVEVLSLMIEAKDTVLLRGKQTSTAIIGAVPELQRAQQLTLKRGRFVTRDDVAWKRDVCVIGAAAAEDLKIADDGELPRVNVQGQYLQVVGVLAPRGQRFGADLDKVVFVPIDTMRKMYFLGEQLSAIGSVRKSDDLAEVSRRIEKRLRIQHRLGPGDANDFRVLTQTEIVKRLDQLRLAVSLAGGSISGIALLVGGIGIMNISLFGAVERTPEIGLRRALGATRRQVLYQFLTESVMIATAGGAAGVLLGTLAGFAFTLMIKVPAAWSPAAAAWGLGASAMTGIIFGVYPARRAAAVAPVVALQRPV